MLVIVHLAVVKSYISFFYNNYNTNAPMMGGLGCVIVSVLGEVYVSTSSFKLL